MKKGDIHYIIFTNDGEVFKLTSLSELLRRDIKLILKRTFLKKSNGKGLYSYFKTVPLDADFNETDNKVFIWNKLPCKILNDERWGWPYKNDSSGSVLLDIEIEDHLGIKKTYILDMYVFGAPPQQMNERNFFHPFTKLQSNLILLDRVGTHQALLEIEALTYKNKQLEKKIKNLNEEISKIKDS